MDEYIGQSALLIGATGATGKHLLKELLSSPQFTRVGEYGRRVTPLEQITSGKEKLEQKIVDFEKITDAGLNVGKWDVVFITYYFEFEYSHLWY
jgi:oxidoreductase